MVHNSFPAAFFFSGEFGAFDPTALVPSNVLIMLTALLLLVPDVCKLSFKINYTSAPNLHQYQSQREWSPGAPSKFWWGTHEL